MPTRRNTDKPVRPSPPREGYPQAGRGRDRIKRQSKQWEEIERVDSLPSLPSEDYPSGTVVLNEGDNGIYRQNNGSWVASGDALGDLGDVDLTGASDGDFLQYDGTNWVDFTPPFPKTDLPGTTMYEDKANILTAGSITMGDDIPLDFGADDDFRLVFDAAVDGRFELKAGSQDAIRVSTGGAVSLPGTTSLDVDITGDADTLDNKDASDFLLNPVPDNQPIGFGDFGTTGNFWFEYDEATDDEFQFWTNDGDGGGTPVQIWEIPFPGSPVLNFLVTPQILGTDIETVGHQHTESDITDLDHYDSADFDTDFGSKDTDDLSEGASNLYYTQARFDADFGGKSTSDLSEGSNLYFTDERVDDRVDSLLLGGANISLTYDDPGNSLTIAVSPQGAGSGLDADLLDGQHASDFLSLPVADNQPLGLGNEGTSGNFWWEYDEAGNDELQLWSNDVGGGAASLVLTVPYGVSPVVDFIETPTIGGSDVLARLDQNETVTGSWTFNADIEFHGGPSGIQLHEGGADHAYMEFYADNANPGVRSAYFGFPGAGAGNITLNNEYGNKIELLGGDVVIGSDPGGSELLRVGGNIRAEHGGPAEVIVNDQTNNVEAILRAANNVATIGTESSHDLFIRTGNVTRMRVESGGDVLIGSPSSGRVENVVHHGTGTPSSVGEEGTLHTQDA